MCVHIMKETSQWVSEISSWNENAGEHTDSCNEGVKQQGLMRRINKRDTVFTTLFQIFKIAAEGMEY